jgi:stage II sporulation protein AA (anti-sigma F factor antagonist)
LEDVKMQGEVKFSEGDGILRACLSGELDHHSAKGARCSIDTMLFRLRPRELILDFTKLKFMDSSGIGLIIGRLQVAGEVGCQTLRLSGLSESQKKLIRLSGIEKMKGIEIE